MRQLLIAFVLLLGRADGAELHAILFIDSLAESIETAMTCNYAKWSETLKTVSEFTNLEIQEYVFSGHELRVDGIRLFLRSITFDADDVVIFYFCGHGFRTQRSGILGLIFRFRLKTNRLISPRLHRF